MNPQSINNFEELGNADLHIDALYRGGTAGNVSDDPLSKLLGVGNQGGFRILLNQNMTGHYGLCVLYSSGRDPDWPDSIDHNPGLFTYYGDNKRPGRLLEQTPKGGNKLLGAVFRLAHGNKDERSMCPPFFIFVKAGSGRDVVFSGLAVPGGRSIPPNEDLVAIWKVKHQNRFQNYRATFTVLDAPNVSRNWINDLAYGNNVLTENCPDPYRLWVETGQYTPLQANPTVAYRSKEDQLPSEISDLEIVKFIHQWFEPEPTNFEYFAAELIQMMDQKFLDVEVTRPTVDGGRDAIGKYKIGNAGDPILVDFALEAKCYKISSSVGVKETSRLISRLRHRQFGILVTTSYVATQAYKEIKDDEHPIIIISARDIVGILSSNSLGNIADLEQWLHQRFPQSTR